MKTVTQQKVKEDATTFQLGRMVDKHKVASALGLIHCANGFMAIASYHPTYVLHDRDGREDPETEGHVFSVILDLTDESGTPTVWLSDQDGDLRISLATQIEKRANAILEVATALRRHARDNP